MAPHPRRDVAAIRGLAVRHPIPPTPRPYGLLPNLSGSSGTPGENLARGSFLWPGPARKSPAKGGAKVASDWWLQTLVGPGEGSPGPWHWPTVGRRVRLFPDFNPPRSAPATADKSNAQASP